MKKPTSGFNHFVAIAMICIMSTAGYLPITLAANADYLEGFDKGPSYKPVVPLKKTTLVNFDGDSNIDDYAFLAAVPTTVFDDGEKLYSHPLLFYQDEYNIEEEKEISLNARQGLDYFMEDWVSYCNGKIDQMTLINVPKNELDSSWNAENYNIIESNDPYNIASNLALSEWSYSNSAVVAVIDEEFEESDYEIHSKINGVLPSGKIKKEQFALPQVNIITPQFVDFTIPEEYKYIKARLWYPCFYFAVNLPGFFNAINITFPPGDPNLELFCKHGGEWMQVAATFGWNQKFGMDLEYMGSYVYENGPWRAAATDVPTHNVNSDNTNNLPVEVHHNLGIFAFGRYGTLLEALRNNVDVNYKIDVKMFPGKLIEISDIPPYGCNNATFKLTWDDPSVNLGFSLIGPGGEEVLSATNESKKECQEINIGQLGQLQEGESYSICVFTMNDIAAPVNFDVEYTWKQGISECEGNSFTSASEGAILASTLNAPLLYASPSNLPEATKRVLYKLGVEQIYLVDIGNNLKKDTLWEMSAIADVKEHFTVLRDIYSKIMDKTQCNDVVFSTLDPWSYWYVGERKPAGELSKALFLGPATYVAAHHGVPLLLIENHPRLSSSAVWHTECWKRNAYDPNAVNALPSVSEMYLTGIRVYDFLKDYGFDKEGMESIITVAGQYDIGIPWDRVFFGRATPGRFFGSPVDTAYWISRNIFYPCLIYVNPATNTNGVKLINGSVSHRRPLLSWGKFGLVIDRPLQEETVKYPILQTYLTYNHRFNERASKYWGWKYTCADGMIPGESPSFNAIDDGVCKKYAGKNGAFFPDFTSSEIIPFYLKRGGYGNVFSTEFSAVIDNINRGTLMWMGSAHGGSRDGGVLNFWKPSNFGVHEENPWRGYETYLGSTDEPDTMTMESYGIIPMFFGNPTKSGITGHGVFRTAFDFGFAKKPILDFIGGMASLPVVRHISPEWLQDTEDYYDGVVASMMLGILGQSEYSGYEIDNALENMHSTGVINGACLISTKYLHLTLIRHGSVFQIIDPWPTSWYTSWTQFIPRNLALGNTIGEAFIEGISHVGILYIAEPPQWWADIKQNVCFFGDPDLRPFVPGTDYSDANYWERKDIKPLFYDKELSVDGHTPFGAESHPHKKVPTSPLVQYLLPIIVIVLILAFLVIMVLRKKKEK